jgi:hypothetical protein
MLYYYYYKLAEIQMYSFQGQNMTKHAYNFTTIALGAFVYIVNLYYTISGQQQTNTKIIMIEFKK